MRVSEFNNIPKHFRDFGQKKCVSFGGALSSTTYAELVQGIQRTIRLFVSWRGQVKSEILLHRFLSFANRRELESP